MPKFYVTRTLIQTNIIQADSMSLARRSAEETQTGWVEEYTDVSVERKKPDPGFWRRLLPTMPSGYTNKIDAHTSNTIQGTNLHISYNSNGEDRFGRHEIIPKIEELTEE